MKHSLIFIALLGAFAISATAQNTNQLTWSQGTEFYFSLLNISSYYHNGLQINSVAPYDTIANGSTLTQTLPKLNKRNTATNGVNDTLTTQAIWGQGKVTYTWEALKANGSSSSSVITARPYSSSDGINWDTVAGTLAQTVTVTSSVTPTVAAWEAIDRYQPFQEIQYTSVTIDSVAVRSQILFLKNQQIWLDPPKH